MEGRLGGRAGSSRHNSMRVDEDRSLFAENGSRLLTFRDCVIQPSLCVQGGEAAVVEATKLPLPLTSAARRLRQWWPSLFGILG
jgi:hypothetical protein